MTPGPTVSIVTPSYNQARFLEQTIRSVIAQGADLHEFLVLDGGSSDGSRDIIQKFANHLSYWRSAPDGGQARAIDEGVRMATGEVVGWVNSDDILLPGALSSVRAAFARDPALQVVVGGCWFIDADSRVTRVSNPPRQTLRAARWGVTHVPQPACFFRRSLYAAAGGIDTGLTCVLDTELWFRMLRLSPVWGRIGRPLAAFRIHGASKGQSWLAAYRAEHALLRKRHPDLSDRGIRARIGRAAYVISRTATLGYIRDYVETRKLRGRVLEQMSGGAGASRAPRSEPR